MDDTDARRAQREIAELHRMVDAAFLDPRRVPPELADAGGRVQLRIWERPSFDIHRCWAVWGAGPKHKPASEVALVRRLAWRRDIDFEGRGNPLGRLRRLGEKLELTIEVDDGRLVPGEVSRRLSLLPPLESPSSLIDRPRGFMLDGTRYGLELDAGVSLIRVEWSGAGPDWSASDSTYDPVADWASAFTDWLDKELDG